MDLKRDIASFDRRASGYERGWLGTMHRDIARRTMEVALRRHPAPRRILDVGCGTGFLLRQFASRLPEAVELAGIDRAPRMIETAAATARDARLCFSTGFAEQLPYPDDSFDLVVSTTSFDHWADQRGGLIQCARVIVPGGHIVLTDLFSWLLLPTLVGGHRRRARTRRRASRLLAAAGFVAPEWHRLYTPIIQTVVATT